jgi:hypothetical protein
MIIQIKVNLQVFWKDKTNQELTSLAAVNCIEPLFRELRNAKRVFLSVFTENFVIVRNY